MNQDRRDICCHGYERPKTSSRSYKYDESSTCGRIMTRNMASVGLQTDTPISKQISRAKSTSSLSHANLKENNFYERFQSSSRKTESMCKNNHLLEMKPIKASPSNGLPVYRTGRMGSCWRHLRRVTGPNGENIMYIDGTVKETDCDNFPPHGFPVLRSSPNLSLNDKYKSQINIRPKTSYNRFSSMDSPKICNQDEINYKYKSPNRQSATSLPSRVGEYNTAMSP